MKRLVTLGITLALVMGLFCFSVNASTITTEDQKSDTLVIDGVTCNLYGFELVPNNVGGSTIDGSAYVPYYITMQVSNVNDYPVLLSRLGFVLDVTDGNGNSYPLYGIENYTDDLYVSGNQTNIFYVSPSAGFSRSGNGIVVPPKKSLYLVCEVQVAVDLVIGTGSYSWPTISWDTFSLRDFTVAHNADYPYEGQPIDFGDIQVFKDMLQALQGIDLDVSSIRSLLTDMIDDLVYTGQMYSYTSDVVNTEAYAITSMTFNNTTINATFSVRRSFGRPYIINSILQQDSVNDEVHTVNTIRYPFYVIYTIQNGNNRDIYCSSTNKIDYIFPSNINPSNITITDMKSNVYQSVYMAGNATYFVNNDVVNYWYSYIPKGWSVTILRGYIDVMDSITPTFSNVSFSSWNNNMGKFYLENSGYGSNSYLILRDMYLAYKDVNGIDDLSDQAAEASDQMAAIHSQEASYYAQNQAAIEATGLNNFTFSNEQANGIGKVSSLFTQLWNALGSWNSVYVFSMTLTLALTILRHVPNRRKTKEKNSE